MITPLHSINTAEDWQWIVITLRQSVITSCNNLPRLNNVPLKNNPVRKSVRDRQKKTWKNHFFSQFFENWLILHVLHLQKVLNNLYYLWIWGSWAAPRGSRGPDTLKSTFCHLEWKLIQDWLFIYLFFRNWLFIIQIFRDRLLILPIFQNIRPPRTSNGRCLNDLCADVHLTYFVQISTRMQGFLKTI